jgi:hypothetical protein
MNSSVNEDKLLILLNDISITEDELCDDKLTDIEKKQLYKDIMKKIKPKTTSRKKWSIAAATVALICISIPLSQTDVFASMLAKLAVIPGIGEVMTGDKGLLLSKSLTDNGVTLNTMYIDKDKILVTLTIKSDENFYDSSYKIQDDRGNSYKLKVTDSAGQMDGTTTYKAEFNGKVEKANKYNLSAMSSKAEFVLDNNDFAEASEAKNLYSITNGITTLNITSIKKKNNILTLAYYVTETINNYSKNPSFNLGTFDDEKENKKRGFAMIDSSIEGPFFKLYDEQNNSEYGHSSSSHLTFQNESLFDLNKLNGTKLKLSLPSVVYHMGSDPANSDFNMSVDVPKSGKSDLNIINEYNSFKFNLVSIERLSDNQISIIYNFIPHTNPKLKVLDMDLGGNVFSSGTDSIEGKRRTILTSKTPIGDKFDINRVLITFASVGPFELKFDLNDIK